MRQRVMVLAALLAVSSVAGGPGLARRQGPRGRDRQERQGRADRGLQGDDALGQEQPRRTRPDDGRQGPVRDLRSRRRSLGRRLRGGRLQHQEDQRQPPGGRPQSRDRRAAGPGAQGRRRPRPPRSPRSWWAARRSRRRRPTRSRQGNAAMSAKNWSAARENYLKALPELPDNGPLLAAHRGRVPGARATRRCARLRAAGRREESRGRLGLVDDRRARAPAGQPRGRPGGARQGPRRQDHRSAALPEHRDPPDQQEEAGRGRVRLRHGSSRSSRTGAEGYYYRGLCRLQLKKNAEAKADLQKALELGPPAADAKEIDDLLKTPGLRFPEPRGG